LSPARPHLVTPPVRTKVSLRFANRAGDIRRIDGMHAAPANLFRAAALGLHSTGIVAEPVVAARSPRTNRPRLRLVAGGARPGAAPSRRLSVA
jgi:hypothetical protein